MPTPVRPRAIALLLVLASLFAACGGGSPFIINLPPVVDFKITPGSGFAPLTVTLNASLTIDPGGEVVSFAFDWDDNGTYDYTETASNHPDGTFDGITTHAYTTPGTYYARVKATDNLAEYMISPREQITVNGPQADIRSDVTQGTAPLTVNFDGSNSTGPITAYEWDFNYNGIPANFNVTATGQTPSHVYPIPGTYTAALRVKDAPGNANIATLTITVNNPPNQLPTADGKAALALGGPYTDGPLSVAVNQIVYFQGTGSDADGGSVSFQWDFDELGMQYPSQSPTYTFQNVGAHTVRLRVTDDESTFTEDTITITVTP